MNCSMYVLVATGVRLNFEPSKLHACEGGGGGAKGWVTSQAIPSRMMMCSRK